jgi:hypothetical protein
MTKAKGRVHQFNTFFEANEHGAYKVVPPTTEPMEQFTAYVDFLGFSEASAKIDESTRSKVLDLLLALSALRGEFDVQSKVEESRKTSLIRPAISTFSDHIVISYPLRPLTDEMGTDELMPAIFIMSQFTQLLTRIAAAALRIGFLVRGGATIGKLYHAGGVVFGEALVDAFQIESRTSIYPRVVLSPQITRRPMWIENQVGVLKGNDGLYYLDYYKLLLLDTASPGERYAKTVKEWFSDVTAIVDNNLTDLESRGKLKEFAKWAWFAREFRSGLERLPPQLLSSLGVSMDEIPRPK